jgi:uroporphyrinogen decarboxylase
LELILQAKVDYVLFGGSGTITLASPGLAAKYALPALNKWSRRAQAAGVLTMLHSCGKNRVLADMLARETDIHMLNPLEPPPMGDIDLAEIKQAHGQRLAFMGNLHTTDVMLRGTPEVVRRESLKAILAAGEGGGFVLSTGDQCGRETPDENIREMVTTAKEFGHYPLDRERIAAEIARLENHS